MDPLSKDANDALKTLLDVEPSKADEARVREAVEKSLGIVLPIATATTAAVSVATAKGFFASMSVPAKGLFATMSVTAKVTLVTAAVVSASAATLVVRESIQSPEPTKPPVKVVATPRGVVAAPPSIEMPELDLLADEPEAVAAEPEAVATEPEPELVLLAPPEAPRRPKLPPVAKVLPPAAEPEVPAEPPPPPEKVVDELVVAPGETVEAELAREYPNCELATEGRLSSHVRWMTKNGTAERGLELLTAFQHRCATGHWTYDSWVARFAVLCALERRQEFNELWSWFRQENYFHVERVRKELAGQCPF